MASIEATRGDDFLSHVVRVRSEIRDKFSKAHMVLQDREADLLAKLQELEEEFIGEVMSKQIKQLNLSKDVLIDTLTGNESKDILEQNISNIDSRIDELKQKLQTAKNTYKNVTLEWDVELEDKLSLTGDVLLNVMTEEPVRVYKEVEMPVVTFGKHNKCVSSSPGLFCYPTSLASDPTTNYLYVCDEGNNRVQVFNRSFEFLSQFSDKMDGPLGISIKHNRVYILQSRSNTLTVYSTDGEYLQSVGGKGKDHLEFDDPRGLDISILWNRIYIAEYGNDRIHCLNLDFSFHSIIDGILGTRDVKITPEEIVVLSCRNPCLSLYSYSHELIREMIPRGESCQLLLPIRFVLDKSSNILTTDIKSHCVCVYSNRGEFLHKFGKEGDQRGEFVKPCGITISSQGAIIITSENPNHSIQIF